MSAPTAFTLTRLHENKIRTPSWMSSTFSPAPGQQKSAGVRITDALTLAVLLTGSFPRAKVASALGLLVFDRRRLAHGRRGLSSTLPFKPEAELYRRPRRELGLRHTGRPRIGQPHTGCDESDSDPFLYGFFHKGSPMRSALASESKSSQTSFLHGETPHRRSSRSLLQ